MNLIYIAVAFLLIILFLQTPATTDGDSICRGEPEPAQMDRLRHLSFVLVCVFAIFCSIVDAKMFPSVEEIFAVIGIVVIEGRLMFGKERTVHTPPRQVDQQVELDRIADVLAICQQYMRAGVRAQSFYIPRWLTRNEYVALRRKLMPQHFGVKYTFLSRFTNRPKLKMFPIDAMYET